MIRLFIFALSLAFASLVFADEDPNTWTLVEPSETAKGNPLVNLDACTVTANSVFGTASTTFPASSPAGGGSHSFQISDFATWHMEGSVDLVAFCMTTEGKGGSAMANAKFPAAVPSSPELHE
ncbi:MAG: hypothetical protein SVK08_00880 [Halobacteriota archaeon]|nr:hypothetical protein [Halobacteriota archaeon]